MAKKLIRAEDVLKIKGYNMTALNGTEILGIIGEYYLTHGLEDRIRIYPFRFVEYKGVPSSGFVDLTTIEAAVKARKDYPRIFDDDKGMLGWREWTEYPLPWLRFLVSEQEYKFYTENLLSKRELNEIKENFIPSIVIDEASEKAVLKFIRSIGGYKLTKGKKCHILTIV